MTFGSATTEPGGLFLSLLTESYAVRGLLGSLAASLLALLAVHSGLVTTARARRLLVLAPVLTAAVAVAVTLADTGAYLPQLWITGTAAGPGQALELLGELRIVSTARGLDLLVAAWGMVVVVLLSRRVAGALAVRRLLRRSLPVPAGSPAAAVVDDLSERLGVTGVALRVLPDCPGGAFATGVLHPTVVLDPVLVRSLDARELEGLLAHELAHVARRDPLVGLLVGVFADLTFFLPPVHLGRRWLRREQEESADELASERTARPASLASSILKVWNLSGPTRPVGVCGILPRRLLPALADGPRLSPGARVVTARVERLVQPRPAVSTVRRHLEIGLAAALLTAAVAVAMVVPRWIATELGATALSLAYVPPPAAPVEAPAFATFRALAPQEDMATWDDARHLALLRSEPGPDGLCPCVETQAELAGRLPAATPESSTPMRWSRSARASWDMTGGDASMRARPLWTSSDTGPEVGLFVVGQDAPR